MNLEPETLDELEKTAAVLGKKMRKRLYKEDEPKPLLPRQEQFAQLFVKYASDYRRAYKEAGYSTAGKLWEGEANKLKNTPKIARRIREIRELLVDQGGMTPEWIMSQARKFTERAYLLGDLKAGRDLLELMAKLLGLLADRKKDAPAALLQTFNFVGGNDPKADMARLAKAANLQVIDIESTPVLLEDAVNADLPKGT